VPKSFVTAALSRRFVLAGVVAAPLTACGRKEETAASKAGPTTPEPPKADKGTVAWALAGAWRAPEDRARDAFRHPAETLAFFGLKPGQTVVEFWPGAGWYTDILAPVLKETGGKLYAANLQPADAASTAVVEEYRRKLTAEPDIYGQVEITAFGPTSGPVAPAGSADLVLFMRNIHNWMAAGIADKAFAAAFQALKPGGALGVEEHRAPSGGVQDALAASGYVQEDYVRRLAEETGFRFDKASEINANPKDDHEHPFGVWTLPPTRLTAARGAPPNPEFDRAPYDAVGESDRMTLRFVKPA
jgi:predicted methyltransferase